MTSKVLKVALRRRDGWPVGRPAPCYFVCVCGKEIYLPEGPDGYPAKFGTIKCECGVGYDERGWIVEVES
jgi:hypothetical protein